MITESAPENRGAFFLVLTVLFVLFSVLSVLIIQSERRRSKLLLEYDAEKIASALLESHWRRNLYFDTLDRRITAFGIYSGGGAKIVAYGRSPSSLMIPPNARRENIFDYDEQTGTLTLVRVVGQPVFRFMRTSPEETPERVRIDPIFLRLELSMREYYRNQSLYTVALIMTPLFIAGAIVVAGYLLLKNLSYRRKMATQERLAHLGEAARTLAHEIKNPLNAVRVRAALLKKRVGDEAQEDVRAIEDEVKRLRDLSDRIGYYLKDPVGHPEPVLLGSFLAESVRSNQWPVELSGQAMEDACVRFDRERLRSVVENLVTNAFESDGPNNSVHLRLTSTRWNVVLSVCDRGRGIPDAVRTEMYDPFFTTKTDGSGIGLSITRRYVEAAGGSLSFQARRCGGTEARITLPREAT